MRVRHRIPSIFSLSMVDVMCCALGCVILLWLLNLKKAKDSEKESEENEVKTQLRLSAAEQNQAAAEVEIKARKAAVAQLEEDSKDLKGTLDKRDARIAALEAQIAILNKKEGDLTVKLDAREKRVLDILAQLDVSEKKIKDLLPLVERVPLLDKQLKAAELRLTELQKETEGRASRLDEVLRGADDLRAERGTLELAVKQLNNELSTARSYELKWRINEGEAAKLRTELNAANLVLVTARRDLATAKQNADSEIARMRLAADNRFAGITLTGRRVIFLVDMSGSMDFVDEKTKSPEKWPGVRNSLVKVMKSLPDLESFQVIVFSSEAKFLLGKDGQWLDFNEKTSPQQVEDALTAIKPDGGTNMYAALDAAFRYRALGLDTVYLFSDGLPNMGQGVPLEEAQRLLAAKRETELSERLSKHLLSQLRTTWNTPIQKDRVRINSIGFFYESPDVGAFLWALSRENDGSFVGMSKP